MIIKNKIDTGNKIDKIKFILIVLLAIYISNYLDLLKQIAINNG